MEIRIDGGAEDSRRGCPVSARALRLPVKMGPQVQEKLRYLFRGKGRCFARPEVHSPRARDGNDSPSDTNDTDTDYDTASEGQGYESDEFDRLLTRLQSLEAEEHLVMNADPPDAASKHWSAECEVQDWLKVRGPNYLRDRRKQAPAPAVMECVKVDVFSFDDGPCANVANARPESWLNRQRAARTDASASGRDEPWTFVFQFMNPGPPHVSIALYFRPAGRHAGRSLRELLDAEEESPFGRALARFVRGDRKERDARFKMVIALMEAPWALRQTVPRRPVILGKKFALSYHEGDDYFAIDLDLSSSKFAERVYRSLKWCSKHSVEEIVLMIEPHEDDELPEAVLGAARLSKVGDETPRRLPPLTMTALRGGGAG